MKSLKDFIKEREQGRDDYLFEMANVKKERTKLPMIVWLQIRHSMNHSSPIIKFANNTSCSLVPCDLISISISDNPEILSKNTRLKISQSDFEELRQWIIRNKESLLKLWNNEIDVGNFLDSMK